MMMNYYREYSPYTDPGEYAHLYEGLSSSLETINDVIHAQLIHPGRVSNLVTKDNENDQQTCENVSSILAKLQERNSIGLSLDRKPQHRVVNNCCGHSQLMASILQSKGIPARLRCGFSLYPFDGFSCDHTVIEVWMNDQWQLIDPSETSTGKYFKLYEHADEFHFGWQSWQRVREGIDPKERYGVSPDFAMTVDQWEFLRAALLRDLVCQFGHEMQCWYCPPFKDIADGETFTILDRIAEFMASLYENRNKLEEYFNMLKI